MNVKELIEELEKVRKEFGDDVEVLAGSSSFRSVECVEVLGDKSGVLLFPGSRP